MGTFFDSIVRPDECRKRVEQIKRLSTHLTVIYGAGVYAREVTDFLNKYSVAVAGYVVDESYADQPQVGGIRADRLGRADDLFGPFYLVLGFCGDPYRSVAKLKAMNFKKLLGTQIIDCRFWRRFERLSNDYLSEHREAFEALYAGLEDDMSRRILVAFLRAKMMFDPTPLRTFFSPCHYFPDDLPLFRPKKSDVFIDGGAFTGDTLARVLSLTDGQGCAEYYAFEPDERNAAHLRCYIEANGLRSVRMIRQGLWSRKELMRFQSGEDSRSLICESGNAEIDADRLDLLGRPATFIKMDLEGAEIEALKGAEQTIKTHTPKLAVAVYHRLEDLTVVPTYLRSLCPDYRFYLRIHSLFSEEMVLYAVVRSSQ